MSGNWGSAIGAGELNVDKGSRLVGQGGVRGDSLREGFGR